jgi:hypothetical protein
VVSDGPVEHIVGKKPAKKATEKQKEVKKPAAKKKSAPKKKK